MTASQFISLTLLLLLGSGNLYAQPCHPDSVEIRSIKAFETNNLIDWELQNHQVFIAPDCPSNGKLLLHLVGTFDNPANTTYFPIRAASHGYKVICLKYPNNISGTTSCKASADGDCHWKYRQEIVFGTDTSSAVSVDSANSIMFRFEQVVTYLDSVYPTKGWNEYLSASSDIDWTNIVVSGHSQGGGHAAFIAKYVELDRVIMFASPNEYSSYFSAPASWISLPGATPDSSFYGFGNLYDEVVDFEEQYAVWMAMNMNASVDSALVDERSCPYNESRMLYTQDTSGSGLAAHHSAIVIDNYTPLSSGVPVFATPWDYLMGECQATTSLEARAASPSVRVFPNPVSEYLTVEIDSGRQHRMTMTNAIGQVVWAENITNIPR